MTLLPQIADAVDKVPSRIPYYILNTASEFGLDAKLVYSICLVESNCNTKAINKNDGNAEEKAKGKKIKSYGLFQIRRDTAESLGFVSVETITIIKKRGKHIMKTHKTINHLKELLNPETNTYYACKLLKILYKKFHSSDKVISAYNAGHPISGNSEYVFRVMRNYLKLSIDKKL